VSDAKDLIWNLEKERVVIANEVKQSHEIATLARRSASARRHIALLPAMTQESGLSNYYF